MRISLQNVPTVSSIPLVQLCGSIVCFNDHLRRPSQIKVTPSAPAVAIKRPARVVIWPVIDGHFKVLVQLKRSVNRLKLWIEDEDEGNVIDYIEVTVRYKAPGSRKRVVRLIYLMCKEEANEETLFADGHFEADKEEDSSPESACRRISTGALMTQCFFGNSLCTTTSDGGQRTFQFEIDFNGLPIVHCFTLNQTQRELWAMKPEELWKLTAVQLISSSLGDVQHCKYLAFAGFSRYKVNHKNDSQWWLPSTQVYGHVSLGGGGLALLSTHCLYCWPETVDDIVRRLLDYRHIDRALFMDDSNNRNTRSGCFASTLGASMHELGHTFNLGHSEVGMMGRDFHQIDRFFLPHSSPEPSSWWTASEVAILRHHHWFNDTVAHTAQSQSAHFTFDHSSSTIHSRHSILVTEYRRLGSNSVLESNVCSNAVNSMQVQTRFCNSNTSSSSVVLFLMDIAGNILQQPITAN